jgi:carnitine-CoA ligase
MSVAVSPFASMDIRTLIDTQASQRGDAPFLSWEPFEGEARSWTYSEFAETLRRFAAGLQARGVMPGQRVLVHLDNSPESIITWLGCAYAGAVAVTTNTKSTANDLAYFATHSEVVGCITQPAFEEVIRSAVPDLPWLAVTACDASGAASRRREAEVFEAIDADSSALLVRPHDPAAPFSIQYTSGTTARPKAVLWTHANALWGAEQSCAHEGLTDDDVHLVHLPLFHTNAQVYSVLAALWAGARIVVVPKFSASRFWPISLKHCCTWTSMVPFCFRALMQQPIQKTHAYRFWGSPVCDPPFEAMFGVRFIGWWGMTETVTHGTVGSVHHHDAPISIGRPAAGYGIHVLDTSGAPVKPGETGDLFVQGVRGVSLFAEYAGDPAATAAAFREDGLFITGDRVRLGEDGYLYFADRSKDMLKIGGENVAASEIERVISAVAGVSEVAVVGKPHDMLDEVPVAFVIAVNGQEGGLVDRIAEACTTQLSAFKRPTEIRIVKTLPRATLDKVAKSSLRSLLLQEDGAERAS